MMPCGWIYRGIRSEYAGCVYNATAEVYLMPVTLWLVEQLNWQVAPNVIMYYTSEPPVLSFSVGNDVVCETVAGAGLPFYAVNFPRQEIRYGVTVG
jgi:hypothetical protein